MEKKFDLVQLAEQLVRRPVEQVKTQADQETETIKKTMDAINQSGMTLFPGVEKEDEKQHCCFLCGNNDVIRFIDGANGEQIYFCHCLHFKTCYDEDQINDFLGLFGLELGVYDPECKEPEPGNQVMVENTKEPFETDQEYQERLKVEPQIFPVFDPTI